jgi:phage tail sheath gpL-like
MTIDFSYIQAQKTPDAQIETDWTSQLSALPSGVKKTLLIAHCTSSATEPKSTADATSKLKPWVAQPIYSVNDAITKWGKGSELAVMAEQFLKNNTSTPLYGIAFAEGAGAAATAVVTFATTATGAGVAEFWLAGEYFAVAIASGDTPTNIGDDLVALINAKSNFPFTAANSSGAVTCTHRTLGAHANGIPYHATITSGIGTTVTCTGAVTANGTLAGDASDCLTAVSADRYHIIVANANNETTMSGEIVTHQETQSGVSIQKWGQVIVGHTDTLANAISQAANAAFDSYRAEIVWQYLCDRPAYWLAAAYAGQRAKCAVNKSLDYVRLEGVNAQYTETAWPTSGNIESALAAGISPIRPLRNGAAEIVRAITTRQSPSAAFLDVSVIETSDYVDEYILTLIRARMLGRPLKSGSPPASPTTVTPGRVSALVNEALLTLDTTMDYLQGVQDSIDAGHNFAEVNASDADRVDCAFDFWPVAHLHFFAGKKTYITKMY